MKKYLIAAIAAIVTAGAASMIDVMSPKSELTALTLENIEALSQGEVIGDKIPCRSQSKYNTDKAYVDCASCTRIVGWEGYGTEAHCTR